MKRDENRYSRAFLSETDSGDTHERERERERRTQGTAPAAVSYTSRIPVPSLETDTENFLSPRKRLLLRGALTRLDRIDPGSNNSVEDSPSGRLRMGETGGTRLCDDRECAEEPHSVRVSRNLKHVP